MHESEAVSLQFLHDEAFSAEKTYAYFLLKSNADRDAFGCAKERVFLTYQCPAIVYEVKGNHFTRVRRRK